MPNRVTAAVRALVLHPTESLVLTENGRVPNVTHDAHVYDGEGVPDLFADLTARPPRFLRRLTAEHRRVEDGWDVTATFALEATTPDVRRGTWTALEDLAPDDATLARLAFTPDDRIPWWRRGWLDDALRWADDTLEALGERREGEAQFVRSWQISALYRLPTTGGTRYLKAVPTLFAREGRVTRFLHDVHPHAAPTVLATREDTLFLMASAGTRTFQPNDATRVARLLASVQRRAEGTLDELRAAGCVERPLADLARDARALLANDTLMNAGGHLSVEDVTALRSLEPRLTDACERLTNSPIPTTIVHGDLHGGNVTLNGDEPTLLDWSDASLSFPFLDFDATYFLPKDATRQELDASHDAYLDAWTDLLPLPDLRALRADAALLGEFHRALSYVRFITPGVPDPAEWEDAHVWHLRRALQLTR